MVLTTLPTAESVDEAVLNCLDHFAYDDAIFLAENFNHLNETEQSLWLLASAYLRAGDANAAYALLRQRGAKSSKTKFILAKCCVRLNKLSEAEEILTGRRQLVGSAPLPHIDDIFGNVSPFAHNLLAEIYYKTNRLEDANREDSRCLNQNQFLWSSFIRLAKTGKDVKVEEIWRARTRRNGQNRFLLVEERSPLLEPLNSSSPQLQPLAETPTPIVGGVGETEWTPSPGFHLPVPSPPKAPKKVQSRKPGPAITSRASKQSGSRVAVLSQNQSQAPTRRSARLVQKENTDKSSGVLKKTRTRKSDKEVEELNERNKESCPLIIPPQHFLSSSSSIDLCENLPCLGEATLALERYETEKAVKLVESFPAPLRTSSFALHLLSRAHFEAANYRTAVQIFEECRRLHDHFLVGSELHSTALWHLQMEMELSSLSQDLVHRFKDSFQTWCVVGNCFSLQKEHEKAIKFLERAVQLNPNLAYVYTLLGHEHLAMEDCDKANQCFRTAVGLDPRHYNAWFGLGLLCFRQEKLPLASLHFRRALGINPSNPVLLCQLSVVQQALSNPVQGLQLLDKALKLAPDNALCRYHRAQILFSLHRLQEALEELVHLKLLAPSEGKVFFLAGKVYKSLGESHLALMNFSWGMELDPRGEQQTPFRRYEEEPLSALAQPDFEPSVSIDQSI